MHHTRVFTDSHHTIQRQCVIKSVIDGLHPMIIYKQNLFVYKPKVFWILQNHMFFVGSEFLGSYRRLRTSFNTFWTFIVRMFEPIWVFHLREYLTLLTITRHKFLPIYSTVRSCLTLSNGTKPTHQSPNEVIYFNHALTPM